MGVSRDSTAKGIIFVDIIATPLKSSIAGLKLAGYLFEMNVKVVQVTARAVIEAQLLSIGLRPADARLARRAEGTRQTTSAPGKPALRKPAARGARKAGTATPAAHGSASRGAGASVTPKMKSGAAAPSRARASAGHGPAAKAASPGPAAKLAARTAPKPAISGTARKGAAKSSVRRAARKTKKDATALTQDNVTGFPRAPRTVATAPQKTPQQTPGPDPQPAAVPRKTRKPSDPPALPDRIGGGSEPGS